MPIVTHNNEVKPTTKGFIAMQWVCSCGYTFPKKDAKLSGYASSSQGFHVHCPKCGKVVAQFVNEK